MNQLVRIACFTGGILLAIAAAVMLRGGQMESGRARGRRGQPPVEELANKLKEAWAEHHTRA
ncbi:MAG: hypothetical protein WB992_26655 [Bryobacteraceae bacterium]